MKILDPRNKFVFLCFYGYVLIDRICKTKNTVLTINMIVSNTTNEL